MASFRGLFFFTFVTVLDVPWRELGYYSSSSFGNLRVWCAGRAAGWLCHPSTRLRLLHAGWVFADRGCRGPEPVRHVGDAQRWRPACRPYLQLRRPTQRPVRAAGSVRVCDRCGARRHRGRPLLRSGAHRVVHFPGGRDRRLLRSV